MKLFYKTYLVVILTIFSSNISQAIDYEYRISDLKDSGERNKGCNEVLDQIISMVTEKSAPYSITDFHTLFRALQENGVAKKDIDVIKTALTLLKQNPQKNEILAETLKTLHTKEENDKLFICLLGAGCRLKTYDALFMTAAGNYRTVPFDKPRPPLEEILVNAPVSNKPEEALVRIINTLVMHFLRTVLNK